MVNQIIKSLVDLDLYKITQQNCILFTKYNDIDYREIDVEYTFIDRNNTIYPPNFAKHLQDQVNTLSDLRLTFDERQFLLDNCPYLNEIYVDYLYLSSFRFNPKNEVSINQTTDGKLSITIHGKWLKTILYETMLMSMISELYFKLNNQVSDDQYLVRTAEKAKYFSDNKIKFVEFGTRRRFSFDVQDRVIEVLKENSNPEYFIGTSNVHFAHKYQLPVKGTVAHEFYQAHAGLFGYKEANIHAMNVWRNQYGKNLNMVLPDTFTSDVFLKSFSKEYAEHFDARQDSGNPQIFANKFINHWASLDIDPKTKTIMFSDKLNKELSKELNDEFNDKVNCTAGIGTYFSNDTGNNPLNIVIKMTKCNNKPVVKLSDDVGKNTGSSKDIEICKKELGI